MFIVFEGIDGTGKSTQVALLKDYFESKGELVVVSREPSDGPYGRRLRAVAGKERFSPQEELELFVKDRLHHLDHVVHPAIAEGKHVILDRYYYSTLAYQGAIGFSVDEILALHGDNLLEPDLVIYLDLSVNRALERIGCRGELEQFETLENLSACKSIFDEVLVGENVRKIPAWGTIGGVHAAVKFSVEIRR